MTLNSSQVFFSSRKYYKLKVISYARHLDLGLNKHIRVKWFHTVTDPISVWLPWNLSTMAYCKENRMQGQVFLSYSFKHKQRPAWPLSACKIAIIIEEENKNKTMNRHTLVFERMITVPSGMLKGALGQVNSSERQQDLHQAKCDFLQTTNT